MNKEEAEKLFSKKYPCMYEGTIRCDDCQKHTPEKIAQDDECDMAAGRNSHMKYFVEGVMIAHIAALTREPNQRLQDAIAWALGAKDDFQPRQDGDGPYWWRKELAERAGAKWDGDKYVFDGGVEPNQPMGPGEYWLTRRIKLAECKAGCRTCQSRLMIPDMTLGEWPQGDFYDESGTCIKNITGHWTPVEGE